MESHQHNVTDDKMLQDNKINEEQQYGSKWKDIHGGYFSDDRVAAPLVECIKETIALANPQVIADIGGGTGFILKKVAGLHNDTNTSFIVADHSAEQLKSVDPRISTLNVSVEDITRDRLGAMSTSLLFIMRSVIHYFQKDEQRRILGHLRSQMHSGEYFVHQSACFENAGHKDLWNQLYALMNVNKWFVTVDELADSLQDTGWQVLSILPSPKLQVNSSEMMERFQIREKEMMVITDKLKQQYHSLTDFFIPSRKEGFATSLHYKIFQCKAI